jgi:hypothetical protein
MFALTIIFSVILVINSQWGIMLNNINNYETKISMEKAAHTATLYLINGQGYPANWNSSNVQLIGLVNDLNVISPIKLNSLMKIDNTTLGESLGIPEFKVFINLTTTGGTTIRSTGLLPVNYSGSAIVKSFVSYNNSLSNLYVTVWK